MPKYAYIVLKKRAAETEWACVNWYTTPGNSRSALRMVQMYYPEMQTKVERVPFADRNRYF